MYRTRGIFAVLLIMFTSLIAAAETQVLDVHRCLELALDNNPDLLKADISLKTAAARKKNSWTLLMPGLSAGLAFSQTSPLFEEPEPQNSSFTPSLSLSYVLSPGLPYLFKQLSLSLQSSGISYEYAREKVLMGIEIEFYYLLIGKNNLTIYKNNIELARKQYAQTEIKYQNGLASELELLQTRVNYANLIPAYSSLETNYRNRLREFLTLLGIDPQADVQLEGQIDARPVNYDREALISSYLENRSDIRLRRKEIEIRRNSLHLLQAVRSIPSLSLRAGWSDRFSNLYDSSSWSDHEISEDLSFSAQLSFNLTELLPGSETAMDIRASQDSLEQSEIMLSAEINQARIEIINLCDALDTAAERLELSQLNLELTHKSYEMTEESYNQGNSDQLTMDDAQQDLLTAEQNLLESQYQYIASMIQLKTALGLDSFEQIEAVAGPDAIGDENEQ
ncbi:MAG: TolC family protein [Spirochaetales bacterium]|nr:TolC family protein [Spirochaetales bacterium]